ncbi:hypothetical protein CPHO_05175 [Corynebacterium phocae]|uniref:Beta-carotene 15,15'-monooxygenase n=1 Tax=Corynebacterium phocae TaxID=161895 RepID=A0A1L7D2J1_9CORY|nr:hypothetical protein [Corynebacterium phocae]APT92386.1 hypothetical protein CPHO_05175 [Corynebacterium phocae]KAA8724978.1 hypothetical protein F4V58_04710 [Corynebacterium phocae]
MTTPNNPTNPWDSDGNDDGLNPYGPTNHPEDSPNFGSTPNPGYAGYANYADQGQGAYGQPNGSGFYSGGVPPRNKGQVSWNDAVSYGLKAVASNAKLWLVIGFVLSLIFIAPSVVAILTVGFDSAADFENGALYDNGYSAMNFDDFIAPLVSFLISPILMRLALHQVDDQSTGWGHLGKDLHYFPALVVQFLSTLVTGLLAAVLIVPVVVISASLMDAESSSGSDVLIFIAVILALAGLLVLLALLITPLVSYMQWFAASGQAGIGDSIKAGFKVGKKHYGQLLLFSLVMGLCSFAMVLFTAGLGLIYLLPFSQLATAHMFRQIAGAQQVNY